MSSLFGKLEHLSVLRTFSSAHTHTFPTVPFMFFLAPVITFYDWALQPVPLLAWLGVPVSTLDILGAFRLAFALRQLREVYYDQHVAKAAASGHSRAKSGGRSGGKTSQRAASDELPEPRTRVRDFVATLVIVHGGEAIVGTSSPSLSSGVYYFCIDLWLDLFACRPRTQHLGSAYNLRSSYRRLPRCRS